MPIDEKQVTNKQHAVPQNIMDVDFKIIGDLTLREFIYLLVFFGLAYWAFMTISFVIKWPIILFFILAGIVFARGRFGERGVDEWVVNFFRAIYNPTQKVWKKNPIIPTAFSYQNLDFVKNELITLAPTATRRKLENYLESYNTTAVEKDTFEQKEEDYIRKIHEYSYALTDTANTGAETSLADARGSITTALVNEPQTQDQPQNTSSNQAQPNEAQTKPAEEAQALKQPATQTETPDPKQEVKIPDQQSPKTPEKPAIAFDIKSLYHKIKPNPAPVATPTISAQVASTQPAAMPQTAPQTGGQQTQPPLQQATPTNMTPPATPTAIKTAPTKPASTTPVAQIQMQATPLLPSLAQFKEVPKTKGMETILLRLKQEQETYTETKASPQPSVITSPPKQEPEQTHTTDRNTPPTEPEQNQNATPLILEPFKMPSVHATTNNTSKDQDAYKAETPQKVYYTPTDPIMPSITPDRVAGRRFTPLAMDKQGTIILPIRGEKVLSTSAVDDNEAQKQLEEKTQQLQRLLDQIRRESGIASATINTTKQPKQLTTQGAKSAVQATNSPSKETITEQVATTTPIQKEEEVLQKLQSENQKLIDEISHLKNEMAKTQALGNFQQQEQVLQSASIEQEILRKQIEELQTKIAQKDKETETLRKREQQRVEEERKQAETLRLMMQMQAEKDRKEHERKEKEAIAKYEEEQKKLEEKRKEQERVRQEEARKKQEEEHKKAEEKKRQQEAEAKKFAEEEAQRLKIEQQKAQEERRKEEELKRKKELEEAKKRELEKKRQIEEAARLAKLEKEREEQKQKEAKIAQEKALQEEKAAAEKALKEAEARAYEEQKRIEAAKKKQEEDKKRQEEAFRTASNANVPAFAKMQPITTMPNAVSGVVKNKDGKTLEGILVIIKRENGEPVRALKTNILGQFAITTPLSNGTYILEIDKTGATKQKFDIIKITAEGKVIPPLDFTGH